MAFGYDVTDASGESTVYSASKNSVVNPSRKSGSHIASMGSPLAWLSCEISLPTNGWKKFSNW